MAARIDFAGPLEDSLRTCAGERLGHAAGQLTDEFDADRRKAIHEARKDVKKARALLRLYRGSLGGATFRRENRALRDAGRELSPVRDADVLAATVDALAERYAGQLPARAFQTLRAQLPDEPDRTPAEAATEARERIAPALARIGAWEPRPADRRTLRKAIVKTYARGREAYAAAEDDPSDERLHAWRKRVKDLRYQQQFLRDAWPDVVGAQAKAAKQLSDLLGDDHDLAVLQQRVGTGAQLAELIAARRGELQAEAFRLGRRVYAESPKRFGARMGRYLRAASREGRTGATA